MRNAFSWVGGQGAGLTSEKGETAGRAESGVSQTTAHRPCTRWPRAGQEWLALTARPHSVIGGERPGEVWPLQTPWPSRGSSSAPVAGLGVLKGTLPCHRSGSLESTAPPHCASLELLPQRALRGSRGHAPVAELGSRSDPSVSVKSAVC